MGAEEHGAPDEPSRVPEAAATRARSLRVCAVHAAHVCQRGSSSAGGGISAESCQQLAGDARKLCYAVHEACTNGTPRVLRECRNCAETVVSMCGSISYTQRDVCYTNVGHVLDTPGGAPRSVQSYPSPI